MKILPEETATKLKNLKRSLRNGQIIWDQIQTKMRYFLNNSNGNTNNDNPGTANVKTCALLLNNGASGPVVVNHG